MEYPADEYVAISEVAVSDRGADALEQAFSERLRLVEQAPGFRNLEVLRDRRRVGRYLMVTRWANQAAFLTYMRSEAHSLSHSRVVKGPDGPSAAGFSDYDVLPR